MCNYMFKGYHYDLPPGATSVYLQTGAPSLLLPFDTQVELYDFSSSLYVNHHNRDPSKAAGQNAKLLK